jgi:hypothetical protein
VNGCTIRPATSDTLFVSLCRCTPVGRLDLILGDEEGDSGFGISMVGSLRSTSDLA